MPLDLQLSVVGGLFIRGVGDRFRAWMSTIFFGSAALSLRCRRTPTRVCIGSAA